MNKELFDLLNSIDYNSLLDIVIENQGYEDVLSMPGEELLLADEKRKEMDDKLSDKLVRLENSGENITTLEQDKHGSFKHIAINRTMSGGGNTIRLYLCPEQDNLLPIVVEIVRRSVEQHKETYFKYCRLSTKDKIVFYVTDPDDLKDKLRLLESIKSDEPQLFDNMGRCDYWLSPSPIQGVYMAPENAVRSYNNRDFPSYGLLMDTVLNEIKTLLYCELGEREDPLKKPLRKYDRSYLMQLFIPLCHRTFGKYGVIMYFENGVLKLFKNQFFPGVNKPINEFFNISRDRTTLEFAQAEEDGNFRVYEIPITDDEKIRHMHIQEFPSFVETPQESFQRTFYGRRK